MSMTKKDFVMVAATIKQVMSDCTRRDDAFAERTAVRDVARGLADKFAYFNPRFDTSRFLLACEPANSEYRE